MFVSPMTLTSHSPKSRTLDSTVAVTQNHKAPCSMSEASLGARTKPYLDHELTTIVVSLERLELPRTPLEHLARTPLERQNEMCTTPPKSLAITAHTGLHTDTMCCNTTSHVCRQYTHTHTPATSQQPTNQQTNQPTNQPPHQPAKLSCARTNQPTTNQPTQQPTKQPENQQPTNQQARYQCTRGGGGVAEPGRRGDKAYH